MPTDRRTLLATAAVSVPTTTVGCLDAMIESASEHDEPGSDDGSADVAESTEPMPTATVVERHTERGTAESLSAERTEWDPWVEYLPADTDETAADSEVKYVQSKGPSSAVDPEAYEDRDEEPPKRDLTFTTTSWNRWKYIRANEIASKAASAHVSEALGIDDISRPVGVNREPSNRRPTVSARTVIGEDGELVAGTRLDPEKLVAATPDSVSVTYELDGQSFETTRPVVAEYREEVLS
ncbi:hypothetical protein [Natrialba sp. SSL1]|uniref:hypothetical protein n=1 Tax=Natrialba sp. SSL1 TaxID=1869245 RepID=UPI0008F8A4B1|nr:hypothetical protein [Natrialba sp. SSL1]OIB55460.1 hypothetical protein BBD46_03915 [Natrialba sp. SSL1]